MPTPEEARAWLAHALENDELAHHGILGMKWGHHKAEAPASGISSHATDAMAKKDAKEHAKAHFVAASQAKDPVALANRERIRNMVAAKSAANPEYAKAFAYHQPRAEHAEKVKGRVFTGVAVTGAAAYIAYAQRDLISRGLGSAALRVAARRGARAAAPILKEIGPKPVVALVKGADGIFRLAA